MAYTTAEGREQLLSDLAGAVEELGTALGALGAAFEDLDDNTADRLEEQLFRPVQHAYGLAQRTHAEFAARHALAGRTFGPPADGRPHDPRGAIERAVVEVGAADAALAELQDSMLPVEVGDAELRAGLSEVRRLIGDVPARARELVRTLGR